MLLIDSFQTVATYIWYGICGYLAYHGNPHPALDLSKQEFASTNKKNYCIMINPSDEGMVRAGLFQVVCIIDKIIPHAD